MSFDTLKFLRIDLDKISKIELKKKVELEGTALSTDFSAKTYSDSFLGKIMITIKEKNDKNETIKETLSLPKFIDLMIDKVHSQSKEKLAKKDSPLEQAGFTSLNSKIAFQMAAYIDLVEAISLFKPGPEQDDLIDAITSEEIVQKFFIEKDSDGMSRKDKLFRSIRKGCLGNEVTVGVKTKTLREELGSSTFIGVEERETAKARGAHIAKIISKMEETMPSGIMKGMVKKTFGNELVDTLEVIPPLTLEITLNGKTYKNSRAMMALLVQYGTDLDVDRLAKVSEYIREKLGVRGRLQGMEFLKKQIDANKNKVTEELKQMFSIKDPGEREKQLTTRLVNILTLIPPLEFELELGGKIYKDSQGALDLLNQYGDLSLSQLSKTLDTVKRNKGEIGVQGANLLKDQMKKFGEKVLAADDPEKLSALQDDFVKAFDVRNGEFGDNGLKKHLGKSWTKLEKYCRRILRWASKSKQLDYEESKKAKAVAMTGFLDINQVLETEIKEREAEALAKKEKDEFEKLARMSSSKTVAGPESEVVQFHVPSGEQPKVTAQQTVANSQPVPKSTLGPLSKSAGAKSVPELRRKFESGEEPRQPTSPRNPISTGADKSVSTLVGQIEPKRGEKQRLIDLAKKPQQQTGIGTTQPKSSDDEHHTKGPH